MLEWEIIALKKKVGYYLFHLNQKNILKIIILFNIIFHQLKVVINIVKKIKWL